jgi:hypothetical protein
MSQVDIPRLLAGLFGTVAFVMGFISLLFPTDPDVIKWLGIGMVALGTAVILRLL